MNRRKTAVYLDSDVLTATKVPAAARERSESHVVEDALRAYPRTSDIYWESAHEQPDQTPVEVDYAHIWRAADKVVYSRTLTQVDTQRTQLVREFDAGDVAQRKASAEKDLSVGGAGLAAVALRAGLVDEIALVVHPVVVGGGTAALPPDVRLDLALVEERRLSGGTVHLRYRVRS